MASIKLENITKRYKNNKALDNISIDIKDREFFILFGPAGAGKTTLLKTVAGIEMPQLGDVYFNDNVVTDVDPSLRNVAMVFENYALYPHLNVFENIAFPLRGPKYNIPKEEIPKKVEDVAKLMRIDYLLDRMVSQLSNGQRQRVALGRALVRNPNVFLFDEPLAHLDAKLRNHMRTELKAMQKFLNTTVIYVTHDFMEAMSLGDRIAILNHGKIEQIGNREDVYYRPANEFVAQLFGEPEINIFDVSIKNKNNKTITFLGDENEFSVDDKMFDVIDNHLSIKNQSTLHLGIRAKNILLSKTKKEGFNLKGSLYAAEPMGNKTVLVIEKDGKFIRCLSVNDFSYEIDSPIYIKFLFKNSIFFDRETKKIIFSSYKSNGDL